MSRAVVSKGSRVYFYHSAGRCGRWDHEGAKPKVPTKQQPDSRGRRAIRPRSLLGLTSLAGLAMSEKAGIDMMG